MADSNALNKFFFISDFIKEDDYIIMLCHNRPIWYENFTYIYKTSLDFDNLKFDSLIKNNTLKSQSYNSILSYGKYKILVPAKGDTICIFSENTKQYIEVPKEIKFLKCLDFISGKIINDKLYLLAFTSNICVIDLNKISDNVSSEVKVISLKKDFTDEKILFWQLDFDQVNDKIYFLVKSQNIMVEFDINTYEYKLIKLPFIPVTLTKYEGCLLLIDEEKGILYSYNILQNKTMPLYKDKLLKSKNNIHFLRSLICHRYLYLWQDYCDYMIILNLKSGIVKSFYIGKNSNNKIFSSSTWKIIDDKVIFHSATRNEIFCFYLGELVWRKQAIDDATRHEINYRQSLNSDEMLVESQIYTLDYYLDNIERISKEPKKNNIAVGKKIFNAVCC